MGVSGYHGIIRLYLLSAISEVRGWGFYQRYQRSVDRYDSYTGIYTGGIFSKNNPGFPSETYEASYRYFETPVSTLFSYPGFYPFSVTLSVLSVSDIIGTPPIMSYRGVVGESCLPRNPHE